MSEFTTPPVKIAGLILAGGQSSRMLGQDKGLQLLNGHTLVEHVITRLHPQVDQLWLCANRNLSQYQAFGLPIFSDQPEYQGLGPLAGIASFAAHLPAEYMHVQIAPCDTPFLPDDLSARLYAALSRHSVKAAFPVSPSGAHYSCALLHRSLLGSTATALSQTQRSLHGWLAQHQALAVTDFDDAAFININTPEQLQSHNDLLGTHHA